MATMDTGSLAPAMLGRLNKHLSRPVRYHGELTTYGALYAAGEWVGKRIGQRWTFPDYAEPQCSPTYMLDYADDTALEVPKLVWDCMSLPVVTQ